VDTIRVAIRFSMIGGGHRQHYAKKDSKKMSNHDSAPSSIGKRVGEFLILAIYLAIDAVELWHRSHFWSLVAALAGVIALLLLDGGFTRKQIGISAVVAIMACVAIYLTAPLEPPEETEIHGWLQPANEPIPKENACIRSGDVQAARPNGLLFSLGRSGMWFPRKSGGKRPLLTVGACALISAEFEDGAMLFNADIYDLNHELIARIERNEFHLVPGKLSFQKRPDRSTLQVYDKEGKLLLSVHFGNKDWVQVAGTFTCSDGRSAKVENDGELTMIGPKGGFTTKAQCLVMTGGFVVADDGFSIGPTPCWALDPTSTSPDVQYELTKCRLRPQQ
jgi:hypothetical protein